MADDVIGTIVNNVTFHTNLGAGTPTNSPGSPGRDSYLQLQLQLQSSCATAGDRLLQSLWRCGSQRSTNVVVAMFSGFVVRTASIR
ncbi:hypothetical protein PR002_g25203 [Phytophthora rubi]|uniref:Uncharacterized protein n=1 Tax=Phytophthora rubi TaxID=129364 RepID=A0A6A3I7I1_9STRA|nr:hypothetical protein PR002_g25203 [Phytophthora rubi]